MINYEVALGQLELFVLILIRLASFVYAAPFFNTANVPNRFKIGFSLALSMIVYSLHPDMAVQYDNIIDYCIIVVQELIVGILLGAVSSFAVQIIQFSGKIIDMDIGLSMAQIYDPTTRMQVGIMGNFYYYMLMLRGRTVYNRYTVYVRLLCYRFQNCTSGICDYAFAELYSCDTGKDCATDEYVRSGYAA